MLNSNKQSIGKGFAILSIASILVKVLSLLYVPIMRTLLGGSPGYGVFGAANEVFAFVYILATAGFPVAISKLVSELTVTGNSKIVRSTFNLIRFLMIIIGLILTILMFLLAQPLANMLGMPESWLGIRVTAPTVLLCTIISSYRGYFQGTRNMTPTAVSQVIEQIAHIIISIVMVLLLRSKGIPWAVAGASLGTTAGAFVALLIMVSYYKLHMSQENQKPRSEVNQTKRYTRKEILKKIIIYTIPITISSGIMYAGNLIDLVILQNRLDVAGFAETRKALYGDLLAARQLINVPTALISALCITILPSVTAAYVMKNRLETSRRADYGFKLCYLVAFPAAAAMAGFAAPIYKLLGFGNNYSLLMYMSFSMLFLGTAILQSSILQGTNSLYTAAFFLGISVIVKAILNYTLIAIPFLNVYGAIISTYLSYMIPLLMNNYVLTKIKKLDISLLGNAWKPAICSAVMLVFSVPIYYFINFFVSKFTFSYLSNAVAFICAAIVGILVYFILMVRISGITKEDLDSISPAIYKRIPKKLRFIL